MEYEWCKSDDINAYKGLVLHKELAATQREAYKKIKDNLSDGEALITIDFKENISLNKANVEESRDFYEQERVTVFGVTLIKKLKEKSKEHSNFACISKCLTHSSFVAILALEELFKQAADEFDGIDKLYVFSDNGPHLRTFELLHYFKSKAGQFRDGIKLNHFGEYHGKFFD